MPVIEYIDAEGAILTYLMTYPGLTGTGNPLARGVIIGKPHVPSTGAIAEMSLISPRRADDTTDDARASFRVHAAGGEQRAREVAEYACRHLAMACRALTGTNVIVQTRRGEWVRLLVAGESAGPTFGGEFGGEAVYLFDCLFRAMPSGAPYGAGSYGAGPYGG